MPYTDDSHEFARQVKEVEDRVQDLESKNRTGVLPNPLITVDDDYRYSDETELTVYTAQNGVWGESRWGFDRWN